MRTLLFIAFLLILCPLAAFSQEPTVCISQSAANICAANSRELAALKEKVAVLEAALLEKDKSIQELKDVNQKNVLDLTTQLNKITADWAFEKGKNTSLEADKVLWSAVIEVLIKNSRKKSIGIIAF